MPSHLLARTRPALLALLFSSALLAAQSSVTPLPDGAVLRDGASAIELRLVENSTVRIHVIADGHSSPATPTLAPHPVLHAAARVARIEAASELRLSTAALRVTVERKAPHTLIFNDAAGHEFLRIADPLAAVRAHQLDFARTDADTLYGIHGIGLHETNATVERNQGGIVLAGTQGDSGAPFTFTDGYGILIDSDGGQFSTASGSLRFAHASRDDAEFFVIHGQPLTTLATLSRLVGPPPMPPRWTLGFLNSQWGANQAEVEHIVRTYRERTLPLDGFIFDFDWKAWGEDHYGEWRWNSTSGPGAVAPNKFPGGASGSFAESMLAQGVHLGGILKPRILLTLADGKTPTEAAAYATAHDFWYPGQKILPDYFSHRPARDIDFNNPEARTWYWQHLEPAFREGMTSWWLDEADESGGIPFNNLQFLNMGRAIYDGQRGLSEQRVWTINRNFYLGASRYGYTLWSGDIDTGFASMAFQRRRMIAALNTGAFHWSMDTGGFNGHPSNENYARWMEFAAFVPIMRVHGNLDEKRQPWVYGSTAEAAAQAALKLRYQLLPYIYSYQRLDTEGEVGLIRPLSWQFPGDRVAAALDSEWMFGDALLVSPIVTEGATSTQVYLPAGTWFDYATGKRYTGSSTVTLAVDNKSWRDIPLFVRSGSILASWPAQQFTAQTPQKTLRLDLFPSSTEARFLAYDDDGATYSYEHGNYLRQPIATTEEGSTVSVHIAPATGSYSGPLTTYHLRIHAAARHLRLNGKPLAAGKWSASTDRFGPVVELDLAAGLQTAIALTLEK